MLVPLLHLLLKLPFLKSSLNRFSMTNLYSTVYSAKPFYSDLYSHKAFFNNYCRSSPADQNPDGLNIECALIQKISILQHNLSTLLYLTSQSRKNKRRCLCLSVSEGKVYPAYTDLPAGKKHLWRVMIATSTAIHKNAIISFSQA